MTKPFILFFFYFDLIWFFFLLWFIFFCVLRNLCLAQDYRDFSPVFSFRNFKVGALTFRYIIYSKLIFIYRSGIIFFFFWYLPVCNYSSTICWKNYSFSIELPWHLCQKSVDPKYVFFFWTLFFLIDLHTSLFANATVT